MKFFNGPILAIESSCDETSASVVDGRKILSNVISSQVEMHQKWGGVVPEAAARAHLDSMLPVVETALQNASVTLEDIAGYAVTNRPGLVGALSVGVTTAKAFAFSSGKPFIGIHHLEGHLCSVFALEGDVPFPHMALLVSGGHTELVWVQSPLQYKLIGQTLDDAAGEAFDKGARLLGLGYPGGRAIQEAAQTGNSKAYPLPQGLSGDVFDFSFSGLKTAVLRLVESKGRDLNVNDAAASLQHAIVSVLSRRAMRAAEEYGAKALSLVGGVAANKFLRETLSGDCAKEGLAFLTPPFELCTDNAAMIGLAGSLRLGLGQKDDMSLDVFANAPLPASS